MLLTIFHPSSNSNWEPTLANAEPDKGLEKWRPPTTLYINILATSMEVELLIRSVYKNGQPSKVWLITKNTGLSMYCLIIGVFDDICKRSDVHYTYLIGKTF